jgi:hypothetical protein
MPAWTFWRQLAAANAATTGLAVYCATPMAGLVGLPPICFG